jgi:hypothetical protein
VWQLIIRCNKLVCLLLPNSSESQMIASYKSLNPSVASINSKHLALTALDLGNFYLATVPNTLAYYSSG